jgi:transposase
MDMCAPYILVSKARAPQAEIAFDPFHVVLLASDAVHDVRRTEARERKGTAEAAVPEALAQPVQHSPAMSQTPSRTMSRGWTG